MPFLDNELPLNDSLNWGNTYNGILKKIRSEVNGKAAMSHNHDNVYALKTESNNLQTQINKINQFIDSVNPNLAGMSIVPKHSVRVIAGEALYQFDIEPSNVFLIKEIEIYKTIQNVVSFSSEAINMLENKHLSKEDYDPESVTIDENTFSGYHTVVPIYRREFNSFLIINNRDLKQSGQEISKNEVLKYRIRCKNYLGVVSPWSDLMCFNVLFGFNEGTDIEIDDNSGEGSGGSVFPRT